MRVAVLIVLSLVTASGAGAQAHRGWAVDATLGIASVYRGTYLSSAGPAIESIVSRGFHSAVVGLTASAQMGVPVGDKCVPDGRGGCLEKLPTIRAIGLYVGHDWALTQRTSPWSVRVAAGPGIFTGSVDSQAPPAVGGLHGRLDLVSGGRHLAFVTSARTAYVPALPLGARGTVALAMGFRLR